MQHWRKQRGIDWVSCWQYHTKNLRKNRGLKKLGERVFKRPYRLGLVILVNSDVTVTSKKFASFQKQCMGNELTVNEHDPSGWGFPIASGISVDLVIFLGCSNVAAAPSPQPDGRQLIGQVRRHRPKLVVDRFGHRHNFLMYALFTAIPSSQTLFSFRSSPTFFKLTISKRPQDYY